MAAQLQSTLEQAGVEEESAYYIGRWTVQGLEYGCLAATPLYLVQVMRGRGFSLRGLARYNWLVPLIGALGGSTVGYVTAAQLDRTALSTRTSKLRLDAQRVRQDDLHLIGSVLGALLLPAIFLRRTGLINGLLGGAGLGGTAGLITHHVQSITKSAQPPQELGQIKNKAQSAWDNAHAKADQSITQLKNKL